MPYDSNGNWYSGGSESHSSANDEYKFGNDTPWWYKFGSQSMGVINPGGSFSTSDDKPYDGAPSIEDQYRAANRGGDPNRVDDIYDPNHPNDIYDPNHPNNNQSFGGVGNNLANAQSGGGGGKAQTFGATNLVGDVLSVYQIAKAQQGLNALNKQPQPGYSVDPALSRAYGQSVDMANQGFTPQEKAAAESNINQSGQSNYYKGVTMAGGNLANAIQGSVNANDISAQTGLAAKDADLHRKNIAYAGEEANQMQSQQNLINQQKISDYQNMQKMYGQALNMGFTNLANSFSVGGVAGSLLSTGISAAML